MYHSARELDSELCEASISEFDPLMLDQRFRRVGKRPKYRRESANAIQTLEIHRDVRWLASEGAARLLGQVSVRYPDVSRFALSVFGDEQDQIPAIEQVTFAVEFGSLVPKAVPVPQWCVRDRATIESGLSAMKAFTREIVFPFLDKCNSPEFMLESSRTDYHGAWSVRERALTVCYLLMTRGEVAARAQFDSYFPSIGAKRRYRPLAERLGIELDKT